MDTNLSPQALFDLHASGVSFCLLDVRRAEEYSAINLGARHIPLHELPTRLDELDQNQLIITHCQRGVRSAKALEILLQAGFKNSAHLAGGLEAWLQVYGQQYPWHKQQ